MNANTLSKKFLIWFQGQYPESRIYRNNSGGVKTSTGFLKYGIPNKGGADFIAFFPRKLDITNENKKNELLYSEYFLQTKFYEIKTKNDRMSKDQIKFADMIVNMGGDYYVVHESDICHGSINLKTGDCNLQHGFYLEKWSVK